MGKQEIERFWTYYLGDDGGVSNCEDQQILLPIGTIFRHAWGIYKVIEYLDEKGESETRYSKITTVYCERERK